MVSIRVWLARLTVSMSNTPRSICLRASRLATFRYYYLEDILDEDSIEEVYDYYMEDAEEGTLKEAVEEFGEDYSEEELRLVRLKFMSEVAN
jgi:hypothetical protein